MLRDLEPDATLPWLVRLRWLVVLGQLGALVVAWWLDVDVTVWLYLAAVAVSALSNALLAFGLRPRCATTASVLGCVLVLDVLLLTALLAASGGASNPFTVLYLVHITLSAVVLSARWTATLAVLSIAGFGLLFLLPADPHAHHRTTALGHLEGMWVAFGLATALTAYFVWRVTRAIAAQREQIASLRETSARNARLASLTTLAAGAAHELGSPLGTIAVAAHEAHLGARRVRGAEAIVEDLALIQLEVERCHNILQRMAARAADAETAVPVTAAQLSAQLVDELGPERAARVELSIDEPDRALRVPAGHLVQSVVALVRNALDASAPDQIVKVVVSGTDGETRISVEDRGAGIPHEVLGRIGEPFFTTKQPGHGLGLGVFLARAFFESCGGSLAIESSPGAGTRALVSLPRAAEGT